MDDNVKFQDADEELLDVDSNQQAVLAAAITSVNYENDHDHEEYYDDYYDSEEDDDWDDPVGFEDFSVSRVSQKGFQPLERALEQKFSSAIHLEDLHGDVKIGQLPSSFSGVLKENDKKIDAQMYAYFDFVLNILNPTTCRTRFREKKDRATSEQCLDPRTRLILYKMLNQQFVTEINGCLSTGKEVLLIIKPPINFLTYKSLQANVYHALGKDGELAVKIYKTSILVFKDRDRYWTRDYLQSLHLIL